MLDRIVAGFAPLLDSAPPDLWDLLRSVEGETWTERLMRLPRALPALEQWRPLLEAFMRLGRDVPRALDFLTAPATKILDQYFEADVLKSTLGTDAIIGAMGSPSSPGSAYVLLHHGA